MDEKFEQRGKLFRDLFEEIHDRKHTVLSFKELFPRNEGKPLIPLGKEQAFKKIQKDIEKCSKKIEFYFPGKPLPDTFDILDLIKEKKNIKVEIHIAESNYDSKFNKYISKENIFFSPYNHNPLMIIDSEIIYYGEPLSKASFKLKSGIYEIKYRPILRLKGANTAKVLHYLLK